MASFVNVFGGKGGILEVGGFRGNCVRCKREEEVRTRRRYGRCRIVAEDVGVVAEGGGGKVGGVFGGLELDGDMMSVLRDSGVVEPTPIQNAVMRRIADGKSVIIHSETGSGKTLAYLLPVASQMIKRQGDGEDGVRDALIIVPSRELALQVYREALQLLPKQKEQVVLFLENVEPPKPNSNSLIITTAKFFDGILETHEGEEYLKSFRIIIFDEIDRMLGTVGKHAPHSEKMKRKKHPRAVATLLQRLAKERSSCQLVAASATVGRILKREIASHLGISMKESIPVVRMEATAEEDERKGVVKIPESIRHTCVPLFRDDAEDLVDALIESLVYYKPQRPLIFLNKRSAVNSFVEDLKSRGWPEAIPLHEAFGYVNGVLQARGVERYDELLGTFQVDEESNDELQMADVKRTTPLLVASEMTARGLHISNVDYVFLLNCPEDQNEYQHLAGRTGRMGKEGTVVSICTYRRARVMNAWESQMNIKFDKVKFEGLS